MGLGAFSIGSPAAPASHSTEGAQAPGRTVHAVGRSARKTTELSWEGQIFGRRPLASLTGWLRCVAVSLTLACPVILGSNAQAAGDYPNRPVRIFVPYGPGGAGDLTIRLLADKLSQSLKQQFVIINRPGAGGIAAMRAVLE